MKVSFIGMGEDRDSAPLLSAESVLVMPYTCAESAKRSATLMARRSGVSDALLLAIEDVNKKGFVSVVNRAFSWTQSAYFGYVAQDAFAGRQWLALALSALRGGDKHLFAFNDGKWLGVLAAFGFASRGWALDNYEGLFFHSGYRRHYADAELTVLAMSDRVFGYNPNSVLVEVDWDKESKAVDAFDRKLYRFRAGSGFGGRVSTPELIRMFS